MPRQIINIVNFIRAVEPRSDVDLLRVVREQIRLIDANDLCATFLLQYDALILPEYTELLKSLDPARYEIGIWHEIVKPLTDACGIPWTGRWAWDWHCHCGFPVGYTKPQREAMIVPISQMRILPRRFGKRASTAARVFSASSGHREWQMKHFPL